MTNKELKQLRSLHREIVVNKSEISFCKKQIEIAEINIGRAEIKYIQLMNYIDGIDDPLMRQIMKYRHVYGLSWVKVAMQIGGDNTADSVRMAHERFLKKC